jgi:radical SAM enzyme (TIGR01210 family)
MAGIQELIKELSIRSAQAKKRFEPKSYISVWLEDDVSELSGPVKSALVVILRTHGCSWSRADELAGGCSMCGYTNDCPPPTIKLSPKDLVNQFQDALAKFNKQNFQIIKLFTSGSFLDDSEVPQEARLQIIELINDLDVEILIIESRPEFTTSKRLNELVTKFNGQIQLALGLESANDRVLKYSINKGFTFNDYVNAVELARSHEIQIKTYLLQKPPFLTERDSIEDVLHSIQVLNDRGLTNCISINPVNIQKFTLVEYLFNRRDYRPPWLWSTVSILQQGWDLLADSGIRLLSQPTAGGTRRGAHNCGDCDANILQAMNKFSLNNDPAVFNGITCDCRVRWEDSLDFEIVTRSNLYYDRTK